MTDVQFNDLPYGGNRLDIVIVEAVTRVDGQAERGGELCRAAQAFEFPGARAAGRIGIGAGMQLDDGAA